MGKAIDKAIDDLLDEKGMTTHWFYGNFCEFNPCVLGIKCISRLTRPLDREFFMDNARAMGDHQFDTKIVSQFATSFW